MHGATARSYDADVPNKTIYVSEGDLKLYQRAQELAGGNLSAAISGALKRYVDVEEGRLEGFDEIIVRVGVGKKRRKVRFSGVLLGTWGSSSSSHPDVYRVYRTRSGKFAVHVDRHEGWDSRTPDGKPAGWRAQLGLQPASWGSRTGSSSIDVYESLDALREHIPAELYELVADAAQDVVVEDLDI
jgi:EXLDI family protein